MKAFIVGASMLAALSVLPAGAASAASAEERPTRLGPVTGLSTTVSKPGAAYQLQSTWTALSAVSSYQIQLANAAGGAVVDQATVTTPAWTGSAALGAGSRVTVKVTPYVGKTPGISVTNTVVLPDLTAPAAAYAVSWQETVATVAQTSLGDDVSAPGSITRRIDWGDGTGWEVWSSAAGSLQHTYPANGLYRPRVELTDEAGNVAILVLRAVVIGDKSAPQGSWTATPSPAWARYTKVTLQQSALTDDYSAPADVARSADWGDGSGVTAWTGGTVLEHMYTRAGDFTPTVTVVDEAGNVRQVLLSPVAVKVDATGPALRLQLPARAKRSRVSSWTTLRGRAVDAGTGVAAVSLRAVQKRGTVWYAYRPATKRWVRGGATQAAAFRKAGVANVRPWSAGGWSVRVANLRKGVLVYRVGARDRIGNVAKQVAHKQELTRS